MGWRLIAGVILTLLLAGAAYFSFQRDRASDASTELPGSGISDARALAARLGVSHDLRKIIREEEGQVLKVYRDITGKPTVGAGHLVLPEDGLAVGDVITPRQMDEFLEQDLEKAADSVRDILGDMPVSQNEFDALVDLVYNVGPGNVSESKSPGLRDGIKRRDYRKIADNLIYSKAADGRRAGGLVNRSERRRRIFAEGKYDDPRP